MEKATELDPRNSALLWNLGETYACLGRFEDAKHIFADGLAVHPEAYLFALAQASIELKRKGDTAPLREALQRIPADFDPGGSVTAIALQLSLIERNYVEAAQLLARCRYERLNDSGVGGFAGVFDGCALPKEWYEGLIAKGRGEREIAESAFARAQNIVEGDLAQWHDDAKTLAVFAEIQALRGRNEEAIESGRRAVELLSISKDAYDGPLIAAKLAVIYAQVGKADDALELLAGLVKVPNGPTAASLRVEPEWDNLRGDSRFRRLIDAAAASV
jgi:tetratricopeptide (TPR) repeat protein